MKFTKRILFIGHDANRAGAQLVLLQLMRLLKEQQVPMHLLLGEGGPLLKDYQQICPVTIWPQPDRYVIGAFADKVLGKLGLWHSMANRQAEHRRQAIQDQLQLDSFDLIFVNTVTSSRWFTQLSIASTIPVITFVHELAMSVRIYTQTDELRRLLSRSNQVLAVSRATALYYQTEHNVPADKITLFTLVDLPALQDAISRARQLPNPFKDLGIPENAIIAGGCGNAEWRKGNDLFTTLASIVKNRQATPPIHFVWVGMPPGSLRDDLMLDVRKAGLTDMVHWIEPTPEILRYMSRFDVFVLCSREDPYPLVVLESALCEVPVLCFDAAGGAPELVETDGGFVVPYLDLDSMADRLIQLAHDPAMARSFGRRLGQKVVERHANQHSVTLLFKTLDALT